MMMNIILIPLYVSLIFNVFTIGVTDGQPLPYQVKENIAIDCGAAGNEASNTDRSWDGDISSKFFLSSEAKNNASVTLPPLEPPSNFESVPYGTARLSRSEIRYQIPVIPGPKFIRFHFYASEYENFDRTKAFFSATAGKYTLLSNFSTSLTADFLDGNDIVKEFFITVTDLNLAITFTPASSIPEAFAFINGIEVLSIPTDLFYSETDVRDGLRFVGQQVLYYWNNNTALETMYRVNIGGVALSPNQDTGFFRNWEGMTTEVQSYLEDVGLSALPVLDTSINPNFTNIPDYTAPAEVYQTARNLGPDKAANKRYNLTWSFQVDSGFDYKVRLHFCEIQVEMNRTGDRVFYIYIEDQLAEQNADVIKWCRAKYTPCFRDYVVSVRKRGQTKANLLLTLRAHPEDWITSYNDAILNGVEIFKLSDLNDSLAGWNPDPVLSPPSNSQQQEKAENNRTTTIAIVAGVVSGVIVLLSVIIFFIIRRGRRVKDSTSDGTTWWGPYSFTTTKSTKTRSSATLPSDLCRNFSLAEIKAATNNFEDIFVIGVGGFGNVYKGYIDNGTTAVAIKRLKSESSQGAHEFKTEIEMLSHLRHRHLVSLIGYCDDHGEMILVYEYMSRGTLRDHLYKTDNPPLPWKTRLEICIGAARGLHYLHTGAKNTIIHRDVKTTNILLDEKWVAKVSDFGLSKMGSTSVSKAHVTTAVKGSIGYLDPEYYRRNQLSEKSDVYSFGVVLCEVLCGRPPILRNAERRQVRLDQWARSCHSSGSLHQIVDPHLTGKIAPECLKKYGEIAVNCMLDNGTERPSMNDVVWGLEFALQLQQNAEDSDRVGGGPLPSDGEPKGKGEDEVALMKNDSDKTFSCSWDDTSDMMRSTGATKISTSEQGSTTNESMKVFSEIFDPKGR